MIRPATVSETLSHPDASNQEDSMTQKSLWRGVLMVVLCIALAAPAPAHASGGSFTDLSRNIVLAIVGAAVGVVVVAVVAIHYSKKRAITGCVNSAGSGMTVTDEKDKQIYALSGNTTGIKPGDRMKLQGKKVKSKGADHTVVWEAKAVAKDFGVCQP
jgi:hypothetical protein